MRKVVFFDIDGTLWDYQNTIPESTIDAIRTLRQNGHLAFLCTGRTMAFVRDENLLNIGFDGIVAGCGTYIEYEGKEILYKRLEQDEIRRALDTFARYHMPVIAEGREYLYFRESEFADNSYGKKLQEDIGAYIRPLETNEGKWEVSKFSCETGDDYQHAIDELSSWLDALVHVEQAVEFVPKGYSKASGICQVCETLQIAHENTYAFGDSINDVEMLKYAAHGIAMGNGTEIAKQAADYVTSDLMEDGIANGLKHFALI